MKVFCSYKNCALAASLISAAAMCANADDFTGPVPPVDKILGDGESAVLNFTDAEIEAAPGYGVSVKPADGAVSGDISADFKNSTLKTAGTESVFLHSSGGSASFSADVDSRFYGGVSMEAAKTATFYNAALMRNFIQIEDDWHEDRPMDIGITIRAGEQINFTNDGNFIQVRNAAVRLEASGNYGNASSFKINFHNRMMEIPNPEAPEYPYYEIGEIISEEGQDAVYFGGVAGGNNTIYAVNEGIIRSGVDIIPTYRAYSDEEPARGSAVHIDSSITGGTFINYGMVQGQKSFNVLGSNVVIDLREGCGVNGQVFFAADSNNTLRLTALVHIQGNSSGDYQAGSGLYMGSKGSDASMYNKFNTKLVTTSSYTDGDGNINWKDGGEDEYGGVTVNGMTDITNVELVLDLSEADFEKGDTFLILASWGGITGAFLGLDPAEFGVDQYGTKYGWTAFSVMQGGAEYFFRIFYMGYYDYDGTELPSEIRLVFDEMVIPEPAEIAALLGALALALAFRRGRK